MEERFRPLRYKDSVRAQTNGDGVDLEEMRSSTGVRDAMAQVVL
jgi:hypothetical protein